MNYGEINNDWVQRRRRKATSGPLPKLMRAERPGRYYLGMRLPSKGRRLFTGALVYAPAWLCWLFVMNNQDDMYASADSAFWRFNAAFLAFAVTLAGYWFCLCVAPQHEGQNLWARRIMGTRVVSVRQDESGEVRVFYPSNWQLMVRAVMVIFVDAYVGWLSVWFSRTNRSWGDRVARTIVIREGEAEPELPYDYARSEWT
ncbi:RDD family protein [Blastococcus sp. TF02A-26]|uniref:RDD family protein n=1 Tax=Blastococcus sp. TF02A-26 TaxID=2250577 RepID=UPI000DE96444|nr:RDD family protein [Blastococcus sp. TF02A-26]RBY87454.1 hypothetical protein DQ240_07665 [Blastococcus sp. TF02A-26]